MPIVELDIGGTPTRVQVGEGYTPADLDHIASTLTAETAITPEAARARSGSYLYNKANQFIGAMQGVGQDIQNLVGGQPYGAGFPGTRTGWETAADVLTTAAPVVAPKLTAAGLAMGTLARGAGYSEPTAEAINTGTQLALGLGGAVGRGILGVAGAKQAAKAPFQDVKAAAAQAGKRLTLDMPEGKALAEDLAQTIQHPLTKPRDIKAVRPLLEKLTTGRWSAGFPVAGEGVTYGDLDNAYMMMPKASYTRGIVDRAMQTLLEGTPAAEARLAAKSRWASLAAKPIARGRVGLLGQLGVGYEAVQAAEQGNWKRAAGLGAAAMLGGLSPGQLAAGAGAMAGPLARTAVAVGGTPTVRELISPSPEAYTPEDSGAVPPSPGPVPPDRVVPQPPSGPAQRIKALPGPYGREIAAVSALTGAPPRLLRAVQIIENAAANPLAVSHPELGQAQTPAIGVMQITPGTFRQVAPEAGRLLGRAPSITNPLDNILAAGLLYRRYLDLTGGDVNAAARLYFGGGSQGPRTRQYGRDISRAYVGQTRTPRATPSSSWSADLAERVRGGWITPEQVAAEMGG